MKKLYTSLMLALLLTSVSVNVVFAMTGRDFKNLQKVYTNPYTGKPFVYDPGGSSSISESTAELGSGRALYNDRVRDGGYNGGPSNTGVPSGNITPTQQPDPNAAPLPKITFGLPPDSPFHPDNFNKGSKSKDNNDKPDSKDHNGSVSGNVNGNNNGGSGGGNNEKGWSDKLWDDTKTLGGNIWGGVKNTGKGIWNGTKIVAGNIKDGAIWIGGKISKGYYNLTSNIKSLFSSLQFKDVSIKNLSTMFGGAILIIGIYITSRSKSITDTLSLALANTSGKLQNTLLFAIPNKIKKKEEVVVVKPKDPPTPADIFYEKVKDYKYVKLPSKTGGDYGDGELLGTFGNANVLSNGKNTGTGKGVNQCVAFVRRFYTDNGVENLHENWSGNANTYTKEADNAKRGLVTYRAGSTVPPRKGDIVAWDGGSYGHVGIAGDIHIDPKTGKMKIEIIEQNWTKKSGLGKVELINENGYYRLGNRNNAEGKPVFVGGTWARIK